MKTIIMLSASLLATTEYKEQPIEQTHYSSINGYEVWADYNPNYLGRLVLCRLWKEEPVNGKTSLYVSVNIGDEDNAIVSLQNPDWSLKPNPNYEFQINFGYTSGYDVKLWPALAPESNGFLTSHPTQKLLRGLSIREQMRVNFKDKTVVDLNLVGVGPAIAEFKRCITEQAKLHDDYERSRLRDLRYGFGQEFKAPHPDPFAE